VFAIDRLSWHNLSSTGDGPAKKPNSIDYSNVLAILEMDDRGFTPELSIFATNPRN
jgi:hypothetical protein